MTFLHFTENFVSFLRYRKTSGEKLPEKLVHEL